jgi:hypothetical protein
LKILFVKILEIEKGLEPKEPAVDRPKKILKFMDNYFPIIMII